jgi:hypothetical protein
MKHVIKKADSICVTKFEKVTELLHLKIVKMTTRHFTGMISAIRSGTSWKYPHFFIAYHFGKL